MSKTDMNKLLPQIKANPASFDGHLINIAGIMDPEMRKMQDFCVLNDSNEVICELKTTPYGARQTQIMTGCAVRPLHWSA